MMEVMVRKRGMVRKSARMCMRGRREASRAGPLGLFGLVLMVTALMVAVAGPGAAPALGAPITFNTALPVARHESIVRIQSRYLRSTGDATTADRELSVLAVPLVLVYGVTAKFTLFGAIPYLDKELKVNTTGGRVSRGDTGPGDATFTGRYTIYQRDRRGRTLRIAPFFFVKAPTGDDNGKDGLGRLPATLQLGTGSWDYGIGTVLTWQTLAWQFDGSASYRFNTPANGFSLGDEARLDLSYQYRLLPRGLGAGVPAFVYMVLESNLSYRERNRAGGAAVMDSGGMTWFLSPGLQYVRRRMVLEAAVQVPLVQDLNGTALENDYIGILSLRVNF